jgi:hypothetical protein
MIEVVKANNSSTFFMKCMRFPVGIDPTEVRASSFALEDFNFKDVHHHTTEWEHRSRWKNPKNVQPLYHYHFN